MKLSHKVFTFLAAFFVGQTIFITPTKADAWCAPEIFVGNQIIDGGALVESHLAALCAQPETTTSSDEDRWEQLPDNPELHQGDGKGAGAGAGAGAREDDVSAETCSAEMQAIYQEAIDSALQGIKMDLERPEDIHRLCPKDNSEIASTFFQYLVFKEMRDKGYHPPFDARYLTAITALKFGRDENWEICGADHNLKLYEYIEQFINKARTLNLPYVASTFD